MWSSVFLQAPRKTERVGVEGQLRLDHAAYVQNWIQALDQDPKAIFTAARHAQQAVEYRHGIWGLSYPGPRQLAGVFLARPALIVWRGFIASIMGNRGCFNSNSAGCGFASRLGPRLDRLWIKCQVSFAYYKGHLA
ncbi:MAG: Metallopeptidase superfamily domain [Caulobacteraceae bacterium]|nr:Metallopeptidase superfamily domain [Caulobacteraceae bacterium]